MAGDFNCPTMVTLAFSIRPPHDLLATVAFSWVVIVGGFLMMRAGSQAFTKMGFVGKTFNTYFHIQSLNLAP